MLTDLKTLTQFLLQRQSFMSLGITLSIDLCEEEGGGNVELFEDGKCPCVRTCYLQADPAPGWSWGSFFYILHSSVSDPDPHVFARIRMKIFAWIRNTVLILQLLASTY